MHKYEYIYHKIIYKLTTKTAFCTKNADFFIFILCILCYNIYIDKTENNIKGKSPFGGAC